MDLMSHAGTLSIDKFNKCGELYRSPIINDRQYMFLSCIYCKDISWELDTFLQHLDNTHHIIDEICEEYTQYNKNITESRNVDSFPKSILYRNCETDPLLEENYDHSELSPLSIKIEKSNSKEDVNTKTGSEIIRKDSNVIKEIFDIYEYGNHNSCSEDCAPDKMSIEGETDENTGDYLNEQYDLDNKYLDDIVIDPIKERGDKKCSLKYLTKKRNFIRAVIIAYQKHNILWDKAYKTERVITPEKQAALKAILKDVNQKFKTVTLPEIERVIQRLKLRFVHHLRLRNKCETYKPLWFFSLLKFLEPHLKEDKLKTGVCKQLNENQLICLIKLIKENECFWNENNIYHTSVINKLEILKRITNDFAKMCDIKEFNVDKMQNSIDEIIVMAREENAHKLQHIPENNRNDDDYKSSNKFYKQIEFLLPHVGPFKCEHCTKTFNDIYAYKFHISRHEGTKPFKCMQCPRELTHKKEFVCHLRRHTKECPFQCNACDKSFPSQKEWHRHVIKHGSKPYVCELCADSFYTQHQLTNHMKNHNNIRDHVCPECGKGFTHRGLLRQHLQTHNKTKCFCTLCENIYSNPRSLRKHYVRVHESGQSAESKMQYNCSICKITFSTIQDAKQHRKEHKQSIPAERRHICDICGHHFAYPRNLADHKKIHSNIRDQVCDVCGKSFTNANLLNQHKYVHTGEKFLCKACGKDYAHYRGLCRHITKVHGTNVRDLGVLLEKQKKTSSYLQ